MVDAGPHFTIISEMVRSAAALVIGNELLTGKVQEGNVSFLAQSLFSAGIALKRVVICPDDEVTIVDDLRLLSARHDLVFTSGGVGPTHDDITIRSVARAFDQRIARHPELEAMLRAHFGERITEGHLRMADVPERAELVQTAEAQWPVIQVQNTYVLPGVPQIFRAKLEVVIQRLGADTPFVSRAIYTFCDEGEIAELLERVEHGFGDVTIGSYPRFGDPEYSVKITFDGRNLNRVLDALRACLVELPTEKVVRAELA